MAWMLVYILVHGNMISAVNAYGPGFTFENMFQCFEAREMLSRDFGGQDGWFPENTQALCMRVTVD